MVHSVRRECQTSQKLQRQDHETRAQLEGPLSRVVFPRTVCDAQTALRPQTYEDTMGRQARGWNLHLTVRREQ